MRSIRAFVGLLLLSCLLGASLAACDANGSAEGHCAGMASATVPEAERQQSACLDDLTTAGTAASGHTDPADWAGLHPPGATNPTGVPGIQIDGYFPDTSTGNTTHGWNHDSQFVIRMPDQWNGGLVVSGPPGTREQYANDFVISDWVLARGYAFAATDKGNVGGQFFQDGVAPADAIAEWHSRVTQLTVAAKAAVAQRYGRQADRTVAAGLSNGGYLVRWQLENRPSLYDAGLDWEGVLWREDGPSMLTSLPPALRGYQRFLAGDQAGGRAEVVAAGFPAETEFLWDTHHRFYWDFTQRVFREELDPDYDGDLAAGIELCASGTPNCDADYNYFARPDEVRDAVRRISLTGRIGQPMITLHGTLDTLLPIGLDSDVYRAMIDSAGQGGIHRYYRIEGGSHVDGQYGQYPDRVRPILPCFRAGLAALEGWLAGVAPPPNATLPRPTSGDLANNCSLTG
ncbi:MAG: tannase/feruloyl esterase family alpha/beta hydrolase [Pseudonocardiaceae bacterium]